MAGEKINLRPVRDEDWAAEEEEKVLTILDLFRVDTKDESSLILMVLKGLYAPGKHGTGTLRSKIPVLGRWTNTNSFAARIFRAKLGNFEIFAIWKLKDCLEECSAAGLDANCRIVAACEGENRNGFERYPEIINQKTTILASSELLEKAKASLLLSYHLRRIEAPILIARRGLPDIQLSTWTP
ncbi:uncharacterized protein MKZ38_000826 [Zalerion maritima]|uniref:Uncharacterized protein n=1 Tax=Zalerion maritima TaxID=339359 RepID=A0AAD5RR07_9PEZI|nr:uncharacterized protein MKZ38_000826 [Zalerion maritima]